VVVAVQVGALRHNDAATDRGIRTAWRFLAPSTRRAIGSVAEYAARLEREPYAPLVGHDRAVLGPVEPNGSELGRDEGIEEVAQTVVVFDATGDAHAYSFSLVEQADGERAGCWTTLSVRPIPPEAVDVPGFDASAVAALPGPLGRRGPPATGGRG
jgi:hypothetical protein